ncbi:outer membrane lipoprotein-sorting protein [bacterium]|nr:outer membrane lipoprotein-sorting protein [bacterium]
MRTAIVLSLLAAVAAAGEAPSVDEIVNKSNLVAYYAGKDGSAHVAMVITDARGAAQTREFVILRRDDQDGADQKFFVYFNRPADVRKMVFLVWKHADTAKEDDRWLYLPALDLVKRIAGRDKRTAFVGSNFLYEDVSGRAVTEDAHELAETTDAHFVLQNTPKDPGSVEFASYKVWIDRKTFMPVKAEYVDKSGTMYRVVEALEVKDVGGHPTVTKSRVRDLKSGGNTVSTFSKVKYDVDVPESLFTERYLRRRPSRKWLQ